MKAFRNRQRIANWREDKNGLLTVTVCVLKEGVYPYGADECEGLPDTLAGRGRSWNSSRRRSSPRKP
ncbi:MAG: hypothetical protein ACLR7Z_17335 [Bilophila wadsworthia]